MAGDDRTQSCDEDTHDMGKAATVPLAVAPPHEPAVARGDTFGRYTIRELIGSGGMGEVYAAHDPSLDRMVALKMLKPAASGTTFEARARFEREAQAMARLNHPNVVSVFDVGEVGGRVFVAMELVAGPTVAGWLAARPRDWREVVRVFLDAGRGLEAAHAVGIVHRDFKPSNVILGDRVRVADFGLARVAREPHEPTPAASPTPDGLLHSEVTQSGTLLGTPAYMSPEQLAGAAPSPASDQYSFCVALHEGIFGARPGGSGRKSDAPGWLRAVVRRGLEARPEARFPSMTVLLGELGRERKRRRAWVLSTGAAIAAAGLVVWFGARPLTPHTPPQAAQPPGPDLVPIVFAKETADSSIRDIVVSRDGVLLAYVTRAGILVEPRTGGPRVTLAAPPGLGTPVSVKMPGDGHEVLAAYDAPGGREIRSLPVAGGPGARRVPPAGVPSFTIYTWDGGPDGSVYVVTGRDEDQHRRLLHVTPNGAVETVMETTGELTQPAVSLDGGLVAMPVLREGGLSVTVFDVARHTSTVIVRRSCYPVTWLGPRQLGCVEPRDGSGALVELTLPDGPGEPRARDRYLTPVYTSLVGAVGTTAGVFLNTRSLEQRLGTVDLAHPGAMTALVTGGITDVGPAGWTPSGSLIFGASMHGRLQIMALRRDGRIDVVRTGPAAEVPLAVLGETIIFGRFPGGENVIPAGNVYFGRVYPTDGELFRLGADGDVVALGPTQGFLSLRCAGDRAPPCLLMERTGSDARAVRWDPATGARGAQVAAWSLTKEGFHALAPDGHTLAHVVYAGDPGGGNIIELVDLDGVDGRAKRRLFTRDTFRNLTWAPDGGLVGIRSLLPAGVYRLRDGGVDKIWSATDGMWLFEPSVSLDGKTIAVATAAMPVTYSWAPYRP